MTKAIVLLVGISTGFAQYAEPGSGQPQPIPREMQRNFVKSLLIPGWGQLSEGHYKRAAAFALIEAGAIAGHYLYLAKEVDAVTDFENFVNLHWDFNQWIATESIINGSVYHCGFIQTHAMDYETIDGVKYPIKDSHYYENVGKYNEFICGWDDYDQANPDSTADGELLTPHKYEYSLMRRTANDYGKKAKHAVTIIMFNHLISAFEAAIGTDITTYTGKNWQATLLPDTHIERRGLQVVVTF
ncbi:MAG: hypothetical protein K9N11_04775 [Lentisphaeria bacterium]|nr:hypothetical protein [Candidatus Neomarinimicrobiota bacterium]MCF7842149.1 hypothetical protein [Lentisphaeria bacterium]